MKAGRFRAAVAAIIAAAGVALMPGCRQSDSGSGTGSKNFAAFPAERDTHYAFLSGGRSGSVFVAGIPSGRLIREIPVFEPRAAYGYATQTGDARRDELASTGGLWGDAYQPALSITRGVSDGRYLWIGDLANARLGRVRLDTFEADRIVKIPNLQGAHGIAVIRPDSRYVAVNGEFEQPSEDAVASSQTYSSVIAFIDPGTMETKFEVSVPGNADMVDASKDGRYLFASIYNLEQGKDPIAMIQFERDAVAAIDISAAEKALAAGKGRARNGVPVLEPSENAGLLTLIPVPRNPHGVNVTPDGRYVVASGRLSPTVTVIDARTLQIVAEPRVGNGPLATTFDQRGNAYTALFSDSQVVKWNIERAIRGASDYIVDRIDAHYNVVHVQAVPGADSDSDSGYLLALNTSSKDRYLPVGPEVPGAEELIDISGAKMKMLASFPSLPEPHGVEFLDAKLLAPKVKQVVASHSDTVMSGHESVIRTGPHSAMVRMTMIHSIFTPDHFEVREGDTLTFRLTNVETTRGMIHGFALPDHGVNISLPPGSTRRIAVEAGKPGVYWYYCSHFCGALHPEMRGRMIVHPRNANVLLSDWHATWDLTPEESSAVPGQPGSEPEASSRPAQKTGAKARRISSVRSPAALLSCEAFGGMVAQAGLTFRR
jgi:nitrous-oxide reductase